MSCVSDPKLPPLVFSVQAFRGGEHRGSRGAKTEDRATPEGAEESAAGQQHDTPTQIFQVCCHFLACVYVCMSLSAVNLSGSLHDDKKPAL